MYDTSFYLIGSRYFAIFIFDAPKLSRQIFFTRSDHRTYIHGGGLIFALRACSHEHYEHLTSMLKPYEGKVSESSIAGFLYHCHNHLRTANVKGCRADWALTATPWLSHDWAAGHTQSVQGSQSQTLRLFGCSLQTQPFIWMIDCTNVMK
jgi:hypothetical protein